MDFLFSCFGIAFLLAMLWSNIFSQSLYDDGNRNYEEINRDSCNSIVVTQYRDYPEGKDQPFTRENKHGNFND